MRTARAIDAGIAAAPAAAALGDVRGDARGDAAGLCASLRARGEARGEAATARGEPTGSAPKLVRTAKLAAEGGIHRHPAAEAEVADAGGDADAHAYTSESTELTREEARGNAFVSTEQYKAEHADFLQVHAETMREIFVLETLRKKIVVYCLTGVWPTSGYLQPAAKAAAVRADTLAQMRAAARGVYVTKGIRDGGGGL